MSKERNQRIITRAFAGESYAAIARDFGITRQRVQQLAKRASVPTRHAPVTVCEAKRFSDLVANGDTIRVAADTVGREVNALRRASIRFGIYRHRPGFSRTQWHPAEDAALKKHYGRMRARELAAQLGRSKNEVIGRAHRLGVSASAHA